VWALGFDSHCRDELVANGVVDILSYFRSSSEHEGTKRALDGALWNLSGSQKASHHHHPPSSQHVMISYSWAQKDRMRQLSAHLKAQGFSVWIDIEQMEGSVLETMAEAVENSSTIIVGLSSQYKQSQACRTEAEYAYRLKKEVIFVEAEDGFIPKGWLGALLGNKLWYSPWTHPEGFEQGCADVTKFLGKISKAVQPGQVQKSSGGGGGGSADLVRSETSQAETGSALASVPANTTPLPAEMFSYERLQGWTTEEVCRWLRMNQLEGLLPAFSRLGMTGQSLIQLRQHPESLPLIFQPPSAHHLGLQLQLQRSLGLLPGKADEVKGWGVEQVAGWLSRSQLPEVAQKARKGLWTGAVLHGLWVLLSRSGADIGPAGFLKDLGVKDPVVQLTLISKLADLLGTPQ